MNTLMRFFIRSAQEARPKKPLLLVAEKLREWDAAVNGDWELRAECEAVFARADVDGSGALDLSEISTMRQSKEFADLVRALLSFPAE